MTPPRLRAQHLLLAALCVFTLTWHLRALALDQRFRGTDTFLPHVLEAQQECQESVASCLAFLSARKEGPLVPALAFLLLWAAGGQPWTLRLLPVLAHLVLILLCYGLGRRIGGRPAAGLWGALLCAVSPVLFGCCRLAFYDPLAAVFLVASVLALRQLDLTRPSAGLLLGLLLGLGSLVKLTFLINIAGPGLWLLVFRLRSRRAALNLALALALAAGLFLPWALFNQPAIRDSLATNRLILEELGWSRQLVHYGRLAGVVPLLLAGALAAAALWRSRVVSRRDLLLLLAVTLMLPGLLLAPPWGRFLVPMLPLVAVLVGLGLARAQDRLPAACRAASAGALVAALLAGFVWLNLATPAVHRGPERLERSRELSEGMLAPARRPHNGCRRALAAFPRGREGVLLAADSPHARSQLAPSLALARHAGVPVHLVDLERARALRQAGVRLQVLLVRLTPELPLQGPPPPAPGERRPFYNPTPAARWLLRQHPRRVLLRVQDPDDLEFTALLLDGSGPE